MSPSNPLYHRRRFPAEIITHCVWLYFRFCLSYRDVEEIMAERGVAVTYETIRDWSQKFGGTYAKRLRSRTPRPGDRWHLDEVYLWINGKLQYLWRAVDQDGEVLDILVQPRRNRQAAKKFFRKLLQRLEYVPRAIITDKLGSYAAAKAEVLPEVARMQDKRANKCAENSHQPTRDENVACEASDLRETAIGLASAWRSQPSGALRHVAQAVCGCHVPWQQLRDAIDRMLGDTLEHVAQAQVRVHGV